MKNTLKRTPLLALAIGFLLTGCDSDNNITVTAPVFDFRTDAAEDYNRIDRSGMPAVSTALIASKDDYNLANPTNDINGDFVPEILNSLSSLHTALDTQLMDLNLTPCTVVGDGTGSCAVFAVPLIIPDTLKLDTTATAGFPNGRLLTDPVIGVTLAVGLLELTGDSPPHTVTDLVGVLNPAVNDKELLGDFPFLAAPHTE